MLRCWLELSLAILGALLLTSPLTAVVFVVVFEFFASGRLSITDDGGGLEAVLFASILWGALPALLIGGPLYFWLYRRGFASYLMLLLIALLFAAVSALIDPLIGASFALFGIPVACCTHFFAKRMPALRRHLALADHAVA